MKTIRPMLLVVPIVATAQASPIDLQIDPTTSQAEVELCMTIFITTECDTDTSPIAGSLTISLDCPTASGDITLHDFVFHLTETIDLDLDFGSMGRFIATGTNVDVYYNAVLPMPPAALVGNAFTIPDVPARATGQLHYSATDTVCSMLQIGGYLCDDVIELSTLTLDPVTVDGTVIIDGNDVSMTLQTQMSAPIDPDSPGLGHFAIDATGSAEGVIPPPCCPGDLTGDDLVDLQDHRRFVGCLSGPDQPVIGPCTCADLDADDDVDLLDFADYQIAFDGS